MKTRLSLGLLAVLALLLAIVRAASAEPEVQVEGQLGTLDDRMVQRAVEQQAAGIDSCHKGQAGDLRYLQGKVEILVRVAKDGTIKRAHVVSGDLGAWAIEKCLVDLARKMSFGKPKGGEAEVRIPLELAGSSAVAAMDETRAQTELIPKLRSLDGACPRGPKEYEVTVYVATGGKVTSAGFATDAAGGIAQAWGDCASAKARTWKLSDPRGKVLKAKGHR